MIQFFSTALIILSSYVYAQDYSKTIVINKELSIRQLSQHSYVHISFTDSKEWGRFSSNGLIFVNNGKAILVDTPMEERLTSDLVDWIRDYLKVEITAFVPTHWHDDCVGGISYLQSQNIKSYANKLTIEALLNKKKAVPDSAFADSLVLKLDNKQLIAKYFGAGHTHDNIVVWSPSDKVLFGGCMVKELKSQGLGNIADANLEKWPHTLKRVLEAYSDARFVIPGHGEVGNTDLLIHSVNLLLNQKEK